MNLLHLEKKFCYYLMFYTYKASIPAIVIVAD